MNKPAIKYESQVFEFEPRVKIKKNFESYLHFEKLQSAHWQTAIDLKISFNITVSELRQKIFKNTVSLGEITKSVRGILANSNDVADRKKGEEYKPFFTGKLNRYVSEKPTEFVKFGDNLRERPKDYDFFLGERILVRRIISRQFRVMAQFVNEEFVSKKDLYIFKTEDQNYDLLFLLGILNSSLISYLKTRGSSAAKKDDFTQLTLNDLREIPIPKITLKEQQPVTGLVTQILEKKRADATADTSALEAEVDRLVYGLYRLTTEEIKIIEGN